MCQGEGAMELVLVFFFLLRNASLVSFSLVAFCWVTEVGKGRGEGGQRRGKKQ